MPQVIKDRPSWRTFKIVVGTAILAAPLFGILTGLFWFVTSASVSQDVPIDLVNPFSTPFLINNDGNASINSVQVDCRVTDMKLGRSNEVRDVNSKDDIQPIADLRSGQQRAVSCSPHVWVNSPIDSANVELLVSYRPAWAPWISKHKLFRFKTAKTSNGETHWVRQAEISK